MSNGLYFNPEDHEGFTRANLPHWDQGAKFYFVTFRLADSLPRRLVQSIKRDRMEWKEKHPQPWGKAELREYATRLSNVLESRLDAGEGSCVLQRADIRPIVEKTLMHFEKDRTEMWAYVVMPNHVHAVFRLLDDAALGDLLKSWKSYSAKVINKLLGRRGALWDKESWDRLVRSPEHGAHYVQYILDNPKGMSWLKAWSRTRPQKFGVYEGS